MHAYNTYIRINLRSDDLTSIFFPFSPPPKPPKATLDKEQDDDVKSYDDDHHHLVSYVLRQNNIDLFLE